jgi:hypothetical protein
MRSRTRAIGAETTPPTGEIAAPSWNSRVTCRASRIEAGSSPLRLGALLRVPDLSHRQEATTSVSVGGRVSRGTWWNAGANHMNQAVKNAEPAELGLVSFLDEYRRLACTP